MTCCDKCGKTLSCDEVGLTYKLISRGSTRFYCFDCLSDMFHTNREKLEEMIEGFRSAGCTLFL